MKKHGCLWWLFIGSWWVPITLPFRIPMALIRRAKAKAGEDKLAQLPAKTPPEEAKPRRASAKVQPVGKEETHKVAGVSFRQDAIRSLGVKNPDFTATKKTLQGEGLTDEWIYEYIFAPQKVELQPEPDNPHDPKAIKVVVDGTHVGYIKAGSCAHIHKLLREDRILHATCFIGGGKRKGIFEDDEVGQYTLEQDEIPFNARLTITTKEA